MTRTADTKDVLKRLNRIKKNRFFTRMFLYIGASAMSLVGTGRSEALGNVAKTNIFTKNININTISNVDREGEINQRVDWFFDKAIDSLYTQYNDLTSLKNKKQKSKMIRSRFFNELNVQGGSDYYCLAASLSNYARSSKDLVDMAGILPEKEDISYVKASCIGFINYMRNKSKKEFDNKFFIKSSNLLKEVDNVGKGAIFLVESRTNTSSGFHAITYVGKDDNGTPLFMSYNREKISPLSYWSQNGVVRGYAVDLKGMVKAQWDKKTKNCNKMEFLAMMYQNREGHPEEVKMQNFMRQKQTLACLPSSLDVKPSKKVIPAKMKAVENLPQFAHLTQKKKINPVLFLAKNKIVLKRKFQLATRWAKQKTQQSKKQSFEAAVDYKKLLAFSSRNVYSATGGGRGRTFDATALFADYKYKTI